MSSLIGLLKSLFHTKATFSPLEHAIFEAVQSKLSPANAELWATQLQAINRIHRSPNGREVNLFVMRDGKASFPPEICYDRKGEFKIAVIDVMNRTGKEKLRARVWCVDGHVFSIEYKTPFTAFEKAARGEWAISCHIENHPS